MTSMLPTEDALQADFQLLEAIGERDLDLIADAIRAGAPNGQDAREALAALFDLDQPAPFRLVVRKTGKGVEAPWPAWFEEMIIRYCVGELAAGRKREAIIAGIDERFGVRRTRAKEFIRQTKSLSVKKTDGDRS